MKKWSGILIIVILAGIVGISFLLQSKSSVNDHPVSISSKPTLSPTPGPLENLKISHERGKTYPGSTIAFVQTLSLGRDYSEYTVRYQSEGNTIYALLSIPQGSKPDGGWPVILFNHGYIPPSEYNTISSYANPFAALASAGYIVFKPDYRGNGNSEGTPSQVYVSDGYITDSLNALAAISSYKDANPQKIGVWGHSMGGNITLRELVISPKIQAAVIWGGVVGDSSQILDWWQTRFQNRSIVGNDLKTFQTIDQITTEVGTPSQNPTLWNSIDPTQYLSYVSAPVQIHVGTGDAIVPPNFSTDLATKLKERRKTVEIYTYPGADHNLSPDSSLAMQRTIAFFDKYLK